MNPEKVDAALSAVYGVWVSVAAALSIQFARTISLALTIADALERPTNRFVGPVVKLAVPSEYEKWVPVVLSWIVKSIATSFAFYLQSIVSAVASALDGGLLMSRAMYEFCVAHGVTVFGLLPKDHRDSRVDEGLSYAFAGLGFYAQFRSNFSLPFPLNLLLSPFQFAEYYIRWVITKRATAGGGGGG